MSFFCCQGCHSYLWSQIHDIPDIILTFWTKISGHFQCRLEGYRTDFRRYKTNNNKNTFKILKENIENIDENATCVSDLIVGLTYMNRFLLSMFPSLLII